MTNLLEGDILDDEAYQQEIANLKLLIRKLERDVEDERRAAQRAHDDATRAVGMLRKQLTPLYRALQAVFGEIEAAGVTTDYEHPDPVPRAEPVRERVVQVWESWKAKLGPQSAPSRVIDALLVHGSMNVAQLKVAGKMANQTVYDAVSKLNKLGLIDKQGGRYSLKAL